MTNTLHNARGKSKSALIREWLKDHPDDVYADVGRRFGVSKQLAAQVGIIAGCRRNERLDEALAARLYDLGRSDAYIARMTGVRSSSTVGEWRKRTGRPTHEAYAIRRPGSVAPKIRAALKKYPNCDSSLIGEIAGCHPAYVRAFRQREAKAGRAK